ncbi:MAG: polysaccharide biosynthesis tyrosine autokinase [Bacteroidales bacterium]|nr:polysaccharide biosynthesis tyrosine autokinase [Bacteroidales bacterium]
MTETNNAHIEAHENEENGGLYDIHFYLNLVWRLRYWLIVSAIAGCGIAFLYLKTKQVIYSSQMVILITTDKNAGMSNSAEFSFIQDMTGMATYNSLENEKVIIRSTPVIRKVVEEQDLNIRYYTEGTFRDDETLAQEIKMSFVANEKFNTNYLPQLRIDYDVIDSTRMKLTVTDSSRRQWNEGIVVRDTTVSLPASVNLARYGQLRFAYRNMGHEDENEGEEKASAKKRYILLYSPLTRAKEICSSIGVSVVEEGRHSSMGGGMSSILQIVITDNIPSRGERVLESLVRQYNLQTKEYYTMSYTNTMEFIQQRLADLKGQLTGVEGRIKDFSIDNDVYDIQSQTSFTLTSDMQRQQRAQELAIQVSLLEMVANELHEQNGFTTIPSNVGITDATITASITEYNRLCVERMRLLSGASESSPVIKQFDLRLGSLRDLISKTVENQITLLNSQQEKIMQQVGKNKKEMQRLPSQRLNLAEIERERSVVEPLYVLLQKKREETMLAIIAEPDIARIVEYAECSSVPVGPDRHRIYLMALVLGLLFPVSIVAAKIFLKTKVTMPDDITSRTRIPVLGIVPQGKKRYVKVKDIIGQEGQDVTSEVFRAIRSNLAFMDGKVLQVTSSIPSEGKSFVSVNLAISFALAGKKTILVETDMRKGHLRRLFDVNSDIKDGLAQFLSGQIEDWQSILVGHPQIEGLDVLLRGMLPPNPNELLSGKRFTELIEELRTKYDYVILDSPPYLLISDPISINRVVDRTLYVVRAGVSDLRFINEIDMAERNGQLTKPYIVLNGLDLESQGYYGRGRYGYGYGYAYGYSYGYAERKSRSWLSRLFHRG